MAQALAEAQRGEPHQPGSAAGDGEPYGRGLPRDDQHHAAGGAVLRHRHGARLLVCGHHVGQPSARRGRGLPHPCLGHQHPDQIDAGPASRLCRGRCVPAQRPLSRQHPPGRPHHPGAGVPRGGALLHRRGEGASGRCRQQPAHHLHGASRGRLSGRRADLPLRPGAAGFPEHRRHHPHVRAPHPRARAVVRRLSRRRRRGPRRRTLGQGLHRQVRRPRGAPLHRGMVRLFRTPLHRGHPCAAQGQAQGRAGARPGRALGAGGDPDQRDDRHRPRRGAGDGGPARQHRLHRRRPQPDRDHVHHGGGAGRAHLPRRGPAAQLRHHAPHRGAAARELRGGDSALPPQLLGRDHQPRRRDRQRDAIRLRRARRRPGLRSRQLLQFGPPPASPPAPTGGGVASPTSTRCS